MSGPNRHVPDRTSTGDGGRATIDDRTELTETERETLPAALYFAKTHGIGTGTATEYLSRLPPARWEITRRLLAGLVQESPSFLPDCAVAPVDDISASTSDVDFPSSTSGDRIAGWLRSRADAVASVATLPFPGSDAVVVAAVDGISGYGRPRLTPPAAAVTSTSIDRIEHPVEVVDLMACECAFPDDSHADWFRRYIDQSVANLGLALLGERRLATTFGRVMDGFGTVSDFSSPVDDPSIYLERLAAVRGHPTHPGGKTCFELTPVEALLYLPEMTDTVDLRFVAIGDECSLEVATTTGPSLTETCLASFDGLRPAVEASLPSGSSTAEYTVLPVHPWQFDHVVPDLRRVEGSTDIVPIDGYTQPASPLSSFRTVVPVGTERGQPMPHVKLPVAVFKQGHRRLLSPADVANGPRLTELLESLLDDAEFRRLGVLGEFAGARYHPPSSGGAAESGAASPDNCSALLRTNPSSHRLVSDGHVPVCAASLPATRPDTGGSIVKWFVRRYADAEGISTADEACQAFLSEYVESVVPGSLRLICQYGIGLEADAQNTLVVFDEDARPTGALVRDFSGIRVDTSRLDPETIGTHLQLEPPVNANARETYETYYELFQRHLGDLITAMTAEFGIDERACWHVVRDTCVETFEKLRADPAVPSNRVDRDAEVLFGEPADGWALLTRRILGRQDPMYFPASNPLAGD